MASIHNGALFISSSYGESWIQTNSDWGWAYQGLASSSDGEYVVATNYPGASGGCVYISTSYGQTWTRSDAPCMSYGMIKSDKTAQILAEITNELYISTSG